MLIAKLSLKNGKILTLKSGIFSPLTMVVECSVNASFSLLNFIHFPISARIRWQCSHSSRHHGGAGEMLRSGTKCHVCIQLCIAGVTLGFPVAEWHPGTPQGSPGRSRSGAVGAGRCWGWLTLVEWHLCHQSPGPGVTHGETTTGRITRRCTLGLARLIVLPQISRMAGSAPGAAAEARDGLRWWHGPALCCSSRGTRGRAVMAGPAGRSLQLPGKAVINQRAETQDFSWRSRSFHLASWEHPARLTFNSSDTALVPGILWHSKENEGDVVPVPYGRWNLQSHDSSDVVGLLLFFSS